MRGSDPVKKKTSTVQNGLQKWLPGIKAFSNLQIGRKLMIGFSILVALTLLIIAVSYQSSQQATTIMDRTGELRVPAARVAASAQANLLKMLAAARGYLALGDAQFIADYDAAELAFEDNLRELRRLSADVDPLTEFRLLKLEEAFVQWQPLPEQLFALRDDRLEREPAYKVLATEGTTYGGNVLIEMQKMISEQALREATPENVELLTDMANYQASFAALFSGLRNYVTTQNRIFRQEYDVNLISNEFAWERLQDKAARGLLTDNQRALFATIRDNRNRFLELPEGEIFPILEGDRAREDLYLFDTQALPLNEQMLTLLDDMTASQQAVLQQDLDAGRSALDQSVRQTLVFGALALFLGVVLSLIFRSLIASPVRLLTDVANDIRAGNLEAQAEIDSTDEIGTLAQTFNKMTTQLRQTLWQVRKEKQRADDLLNVVIPIGVDLSSEKDFNRLLEKMLVEAKAFCRANAGILYLRTGDDNLSYVIIRNDSDQIHMGGATGTEVPYATIPMYHNGQPNRQDVAVVAAINGVTVNIADARQIDTYDFSGPESDEGYYATSYLTIPLKNSHNQVTGVLQLLDARDPESNEIIPFDQNLQQMMESFSSLAVAALEAYIREQTLRQEIQQLRIEIDAVKREQQVEEIIETDFFRDLQTKAKEMRQRGRR
jgi:CHASE3 domain sensor protein